MLSEIFLKPIIGAGWSEPAQAFVENVDEKPNLVGGSWWLRQGRTDGPNGGPPATKFGSLNGDIQKMSLP